MKIGIVAKLKHGDLLEAMMERGWNQRQLGEFLGLSPVSIGEILNMKRVPTISNELEAKLVELTGKTSEQLFPAVTRTEEFRKSNKTLIAFREADPAALAGSGVRCLPLPEYLGGREDVLGAILDAFSVLKPRDKEIILRVADGDSLEQLAAELKISPHYIQEVHRNARKQVLCKTRDLLTKRFGSQENFG